MILLQVELASRRLVQTSRGSNNRKPRREWHKHTSALTGTCSHSERYPVRLVRAILRGLRRALRRGLPGGGHLCEIESGPTLEERGPEEESAMLSSEPDPSGSPWAPTAQTEFFDDLTGFALEPPLVRLARIEEINYLIMDLDVWEIVDRDFALERMNGMKPIPLRWVDINKGSETSKEYRSRLVVMETKRRSTIAPEDKGAVFSATPPLEAVRMLASLAMSIKGPIAQHDPDNDIVIGFLDISRAHPHVEMKRELYSELPPEHPENSKAKVGRLRRHLHGVRDAGQNFELKVQEVSERAGAKRGVHHPCVFSMVERGLHYLHHGDDFAIVGTRSEVKWISEQIGQTFIVKDRGTLGPRHWDKKVMTILHRVLRWVPHSDNGPERIEYEADPRHREVLSLQRGLADGKTRSVTSPFEKIKITPDTERELQESEATVFRSAVMRLGFLALDRPDIQFGAKEAARGMARPTVRHQLMLKRCARYLLQAKTLTWCFARQRFPRCILVRSDTDWAGCPLNRRSTSGTSVHFGQHTWYCRSTTQVPVSLSSGEAETYGVTKAFSRAIGMRNLANDLGFEGYGELSLEVQTDSSAALAICQRRGCGRIRHLEAGCLWIQAALASKRVNQLTKVLGAKNTADILTKSVSRRDLDKHLLALRLEIRNDRAQEVPQATVVERVEL